MSYEALKIVYSITAFQLFFLSIAILLQPRPLQKHNYWLAAFLFVKSVVIVIILACWYYSFIPYNFLVKLVTIFLDYSLFPIFYVFVLQLSKHNLKFKPVTLLALVPYSLAIIILIIPAEFKSGYQPYFEILSKVNYHLQALVYLYLSEKQYRKFRTNMQNYVNQDLIQRLKWLRFCIIGLMYIWGTIFFVGVIRIFQPERSVAFDIIMELLFLLTILVLLIWGVRYPKELIRQIESINNKYAFSKLTEKYKNEILHNLKKLMESDKLFRMPNLTLNKLSEILNVQEKQLSQVINECCEQNFCEYINTLRIQDACKMLTDPKNKEKTILEIAYETGFNSKSVFNSRFKTNTGKTPTEFRKTS